MSVAQDSRLVVMAAGASRRFGRLKQTEPVGPAGEAIPEFSAYDARRVGFSHVVFVLRREIEEDFRKKVGRRVDSDKDLTYVFQAATESKASPPRTKPWGTAHAVLTAAPHLEGHPFAVVNADDFYGPASFDVLAHQSGASPQDVILVAFDLSNTLSGGGGVTRGVCTVDPQGRLVRVKETFEIQRGDEGIFTRHGGSVERFSGHEPVSMNLWGFPASSVDVFKSEWDKFLSRHSRSQTAEFFIPDVVTAGLQDARMTVRIARTPETWCGLTHKSDRQNVVDRLRALSEAGAYPMPLWEGAFS